MISAANPAAWSLPAVDVTVLRPSASGTDDMGEPVAGGPSREEVAGVLFEPAGTSGLSGSLRLAGVEVDAQFAFPSGYTGSLRGCSIEHAGRVWAVVGDPQPYTASPLPWDRDVPVREVS